MAGIAKRCRMLESKKYWEELDITTYQFFKIMIGDFRKQLRIPRKFMINFRGSLSENIKLVGPSGHVWTVKLVESADDTLLQSGWQKFVKDHSLEFGDFLVFKYNNKSSFKVTVFDKSGCEREGPYFIKKHSSCWDDGCALENRNRKDPCEIIDVDSPPHMSVEKKTFRNGRENLCTRSADNKLKRPLKTQNRETRNANLADANRELDSRKDYEDLKEFFFGEVDFLPKERNKYKRTYDPAYQTGGSRCKTSRPSKKNGAGGQKNIVKPTKRVLYSYVPTFY